MMMPATYRTCVVISYWIGESQAQLHRLLRQIRDIDAGAPFDLRIVCNGGDERPLILPAEFTRLGAQILNRENVGYNIAAWDHGWKIDVRHDFYLFLQSECFLKRPGWVEAFEFRMTRDAGVGLVGERIMWDRLTWSFIRADTDRDLGQSVWPAYEPDHPIDRYQHLMTQAGIPIGDVGTHVPTIIHFTARHILEEVGGYPFFGPSYREAVGSEVAISRLIEARGYRVVQLKGHPFAYIGHRQWSPPTWHEKLETKARRIVKSIVRLAGDAAPR